MFEICPNNHLTEKGLTYLVNLMEESISQKELYELLKLSWSDRVLFKTWTPDKSTKRVWLDLNTPLTELSIKDNVKGSLKSTILCEVLSLMNNSEDTYLRKLSAYILCMVTFNNSEIQKELCRLFSFTPFGTVVVLNQFPKNLIKHYTKKHKLSKSNSLF